MACALAIGGLDPGGGAGIAADLRAFAAAGVFGCAAVSVITVQSTSGLRSVRAVDARDVIAQAREVLLHQRVRALKIGALGSASNVRAVGALLAKHRDLPSIVDPVMVPTRGRARLLDASALRAMRMSLIPSASLVTANVAEAEALTGKQVRTLDEASEAALALCAMGARAALVKGGHLDGPNAVDILAIDGDILALRAKRLRLPPLHGGGCTLASLIAGRIAKDRRAYEGAPSAILVDAVRWAKSIHGAALAKSRDVGGAMRVLVP